MVKDVVQFQMPESRFLIKYSLFGLIKANLIVILLYDINKKNNSSSLYLQIGRIVRVSTFEE